MDKEESAHEETEGVETSEDAEVCHGTEPAGDAQHSALDFAPVDTMTAVQLALCRKNNM